MKELNKLIENLNHLTINVENQLNKNKNFSEIKGYYKDFRQKTISDLKNGLDEEMKIPESLHSEIKLSNVLYEKFIGQNQTFEMPIKLFKIVFSSLKDILKENVSWTIANELLDFSEILIKKNNKSNNGF